MWIKELSSLKGVVKTDGKSTDLRGYSNIKIGGKATCIFEPTGYSIDEVTEELINVVHFCRQKGIRYWTIGNASNTLFGDVEGVIILNRKQFKECDVKLDGDIVTVEAGAHMPSLSRFAYKNSLSGLEYAVQLPGCLGGAIVMNAACDIVDEEATTERNRKAFTGRKYYRSFDSTVYSIKQSTSDIVEEVTIIDNNGNLRVLGKDRLGFDCRWSVLQSDNHKGSVVVSAKLKLKPKPKNEIEACMREYVAKRKRENQPLNEPSLGSIFIKKGYVLEHGRGIIRDETIESLFADRLIKRAFGTKVHRDTFREEYVLNPICVGGIYVDTKCPGFFVNSGTGTLDDFLKLYQIIYEGVKEKTGIELMPEVKFIPEEIAPECAILTTEKYAHWRYVSYLRRGVDMISSQPIIALRYLDKALEYKPGDDAALINKGFSFGILENWVESARIFEDIDENKRSDDSRIPFFRAYCYHNMGQFSKAITLYRIFLENLLPLENPNYFEKRERDGQEIIAKRLIHQASQRIIDRMARHDCLSFEAIISSE